MREAILLAVTLLTFVGLSFSLSYKRSVNLTRVVLDGYDARQRPVSEQKDTLSVACTFHLLTLRDFDEIAAKFSVHGKMLITWKDQIITWDPNKYDETNSAVFRLTEVWYPKIVLHNSHSGLKTLGEDWLTVRLQSSGATSFTSTMLFDAMCKVDVTYYPLDTQKCNLLLTVLGYYSTEVTLVAMADEVNTDHFSENGEWTLVSTSVTRKPGGKYTPDFIAISFTIKRKPAFLFITVLLPIMFLVILNLLVVVLPVESGERVSYTVTLLLALAVFMTLIVDNLPKKSEPVPLLGYFLMILVALSTLISFTTVVNLHLYFKKGQVPNFMKSLVRIKFCFTCRFSKMSKSKINHVQPVKTPDLKEFSDDTFDDTVNTESDITWQDVSATVDWALALVFFLTTVIVSTVFLLSVSVNM